MMWIFHPACFEFAPSKYSDRVCYHRRGYRSGPSIHEGGSKSFCDACKSARASQNIFTAPERSRGASSYSINQRSLDIRDPLEGCKPILTFELGRSRGK